MKGHGLSTETPKKGEGRALTIWIRSDSRLAFQTTRHEVEATGEANEHADTRWSLTRSRRKLSHTDAHPILSSQQAGFGGLLEMKTTHRQRCLKRRVNSSPAKEEPNQIVSLASIELKPPMLDKGEL